MSYPRLLATYKVSAACGNQAAARRGTLTLQAMEAAGMALVAVSLLTTPAYPQIRLGINKAAQLAAQHAPTVDPGTLVALAYNEIRLHPWAVNTTTTGRSYFPASLADDVALATPLAQQGHSLDLRILQVNDANIARTGLTVASAFDPASSMRAGALILVAAYRQCLHGGQGATHAEQQAALRCAASVYSTGREQAGLLNSYQARIWNAAAQVVPAIQVTVADPQAAAAPADTATSQPPRPPPAPENALRAGPPVPSDPEGLTDALHRPNPKEPSP